MSDEIIFGDFEPDDAFTEGDIELDPNTIDKLVGQIESIQEIDDDDDRLEAAKIWAEELEGD